MARGDFVMYIDSGSLRSMQRVEKLLSTLGDKITPAIARALNRSIKGIPTDASRAVAQEYGIKVGEVRSTFVLVKRAAPQSLNAEVISRGNVIPLYRFSARPKKPSTHPSDARSKRVKVADGVSVRVREPSTLSGSFIARMSSGHTGVFVRRANRSIYELFGPSVPHMIDTRMEEDDDLLERGLDERFEKRLDHEVSRLLGGK